MFPLALPRRLNSLRYSSVLGVLCASYLVVAVLTVFLSDKILVPDPSGNLKELPLFKVNHLCWSSVLPIWCLQHLASCHFRLYVPAQLAHDIQRDAVEVDIEDELCHHQRHAFGGPFLHLYWDFWLSYIRQGPKWPWLWEHPRCTLPEQRSNLDRIGLPVLFYLDLSSSVSAALQRQYRKSSK